MWEPGNSLVRFPHQRLDLSTCTFCLAEPRRCFVRKKSRNKKKNGVMGTGWSRDAGMVSASRAILLVMLRWPGTRVRRVFVKERHGRSRDRQPGQKVWQKWRSPTSTARYSVAYKFENLNLMSLDRRWLGCRKSMRISHIDPAAMRSACEMLPCIVLDA